MIKQELGHTTIKGNMNVLLSELTALTHALCKDLSESSGVPYEEIVERVQTSVTLYKLTDSGMDVEEAMDVLDMKQYVKKVVLLDEGGDIDSGEEVYSSEQDN